MQITEVRKSCTCLDYVPMTKVLQPNETAEFTVTMNTGKFVGFNAQTFYVTFGPKYVSTAVIRVQATSRTDVSINPGGVRFGTVPAGYAADAVGQHQVFGQDARLEADRDRAGAGAVRREGDRGQPRRTVPRRCRVSGGRDAEADRDARPDFGASEHQDQRPDAPDRAGRGDRRRSPRRSNSRPNKVRFDAVAVGESAAQRVLVRAAKPFKVLGVDGAGSGVSVELPARPARRCRCSS